MVGGAVEFNATDSGHSVVKLSPLAQQHLDAVSGAPCPALRDR